MSLAISIRFLTGRAHLHPWSTHHSEGRVEWPPSHWRLLRALVAVAGRGLTSLPYPDFIADPGPKPKSTKKNPNPVWPRADYSSLPDGWHGEERADEIPLSRLSQLLHLLSPPPTIWLPKTSGGHTRQYFPIHEGGMVKNTGSTVFDTFAVIRKDQPLLFHWPSLQLDQQPHADLKLLLDRMTYFGRAESWCRAEAHTCALEGIKMDGMNSIVSGQTHWDCVCLEDRNHKQPSGKEYRDYLLERRLAAAQEIQDEVIDLLPRTKQSDGKTRKDNESFRSILRSESSDRSLLRCLLRESGQDIKDGLERPIGTRWVHYAVPRAVYEIPRPRPQPRPRASATVDLVRYALNTATTHRPVLPPLTDTLLVADKFRSAAMAVCGEPGRALSGHEDDGSPCKDHQHAFWWPFDEDDDGFIDHIMIWAPRGFEQREVDALRRLTRLRQRGGRPDLLVSPTYVGQASEYPAWREAEKNRVTTFVSATPYFCPLHLSHGVAGSGRLRPIKRVIREGLHRQGISEAIEEISEIVFDYAPEELVLVQDALAAGAMQEPVPPRQGWGPADGGMPGPPLARPHDFAVAQFRGACLKDPDEGFPFGLSLGLRVENGSRFVRAVSFGRRRRQGYAKGHGRMLRIRFEQPRPARPFAVGDQCHFGLGLFVPVLEKDPSPWP